MMTPRVRKEIDTSTYTGRFAARLKMLRERVGLSVEEAAAKLGVKPITIYAWEQGRNSPNVESFPAIAKVYNMKRLRDILPEK